MQHRILWYVTLWFVLGVLLLALCAPLLSHAEEGSNLEMFVSPKTTELHEQGDEYVVWAAVKTEPRARITFEMTLDPRVQYVTGKGAMPTYDGAGGGGGACAYGDDTVMVCRAIANRHGWVGITAHLRFEGDPATYTGHTLEHHITVRAGSGELTDKVTIFIPHGNAQHKLYVPLGGGDQ